MDMCAAISSDSLEFRRLLGMVALIVTDSALRELFYEGTRLDNSSQTQELMTSKLYK